MTTQRVFIIDDDPVIRALTSDCVSMLGHQVTSFDSGESFLDQISSLQAPDILFLDMMMPNLTGIEVLQKIRANQKIKNLYVVLLSANNDVAEILNANHVHADDCLQKPFQMKDLMATIQRAQLKN